MFKIAVCDDEQRYLHDVNRLLDEYGAAHGIELVAAAFSLPFDLSERVESGAEFDLYLLDVYMPGMTGIELAGQLRPHRRRGGVPTVLRLLFPPAKRCAATAGMLVLPLCGFPLRPTYGA